MSFGNQRIPIVVLKEGTQDSQGKGHLISNINACLAVQDTIKSTLGPLGADKLIVNGSGEVTISNDGATIMKLLEIVHPAANILVDIAKSQDAETGDGTTSVVVLAGEFLREALQYIEDGIGSNLIIKGYRKACQLAVKKIKEISINIDRNDKEKFQCLLRRCAATAMSSKIIKSCSDHFVDIVVDAVTTLDPEDLNEKYIGIKKVSGGAMQDSFLVKGVAFKKTFSYAGFEQQPKQIENAKIICLNVELELKAEKDNAEVRVEDVKDYQDVVDAEWKIIFRQLESIVKSGANVVFSTLPIGDLATQYFADRQVFCAGRLASDDMQRVIQAVGGSIQSTCLDIEEKYLGSCRLFEERQIGADRYNILTGCPKAKSSTLVLRGGADQFIAEVERSVHDAIMIVKCAIKNQRLVAGGGAVEMEVSKYLRDYALSITGKTQNFILSYAKALEAIPRFICDNAGLDSTDILNKLRMRHAKGELWAGVDLSDSIDHVANLFDLYVWEPNGVKINALEAATEAAAVILSVDETIKNVDSENGQGENPMVGQQAAAMAQNAGAVAGKSRGGAMPQFR